MLSVQLRGMLLMRKITGLCFLCTAFLFFGCEPPKAVIPAVLPEVEGIKLRDLPYNPSQVVIAEVKALDEVNLVARVEGFLRKRFFKEGSRVKKGELLFEIEPELYQAKVKAAQAKLTRARVAQKNADTDYKRQRQLLSSKAVSERTFDKVEATKLEADADVKNAEAELEIARQNLSYTRILAPFDGVIGLSNYSDGNLVNASSGTLATVVRNDVVRVEFVVSELQLLNMLGTGKNAAENFKFELITQDGKVYPFPGKISFWDNRVNSSTGTFRIQAEFPNPKGALTPGMFGRIRMTSRKAAKGVIVPEEALMADQAGEYLYTVAPDGVVARRNVHVAYREKGFAVISSGVKTGDVIVDAGIQHVRPGAKCKVKLHDFSMNNGAGAGKSTL